MTLGEAWIAKFWDRVDRRGPNDCWPWLGRWRWTNGGKRAGSFGAPPRELRSRLGSAIGVVAAYRFACALGNGPVPWGAYVCHRCNNALCCNPAHLYAGDAKTNGRDLSLALAAAHPPGLIEKMYRITIEQRTALAWASLALQRRRGRGKVGRSEVARALLDDWIDSGAALPERLTKGKR